MAQIVYPRAPDVFKTQSNVLINVATPVWTPATGKKFRLMGWDLVCDTDGSLTFSDGATNIYICPVQANIPCRMPIGMVGILSSQSDQALKLIGPASSHVTGTIFGEETSGTTAN